MDTSGLSGKLNTMVNKISTLSFFLCLFSWTAIAQTVFMSKKGEVSFYSYAPLENIEAKTTNINSVLNTGTGEIAFIIPMRTFKFERELMEEHFNEKYIESDKYPQAIFKGKVNEKISMEDGKYDVTATGTLSLHGVDKLITEPGSLTVAGKTLKLETSFNLAVADFNISIPKLLFENIADTVQVRINALYEPFKKND
jgi:hypothetical protein